MSPPISISDVGNGFRWPGGELHGLSGRHRQTRSPLRAGACGLQPLRLLPFRADVVSGYLLYAAICEYHIKLRAIYDYLQVLRESVF